ncbi:MAG: GNAT family N-acetyltransferase, partial [Thermoplasmatota archaeon]
MSSYSVELMQEKEKWNDCVDKSPMGSIFHKFEFLEVIKKHTSSQLHTLVGYKGQEPIGLFPVFEIKRGPMSTVFSPPPEVGIPFIGPILVNYENLKQKKKESRNRNFIEKIVEYINNNISPSYISITSSPEYK